MDKCTRFSLISTRSSDNQQGRIVAVRVPDLSNKGMIEPV